MADASYHLRFQVGTGTGGSAMLRRLEDRIQELCAKVVAVRGTEEFEGIIKELQSALREQSERLRQLAASAAINKRFPPDRRHSGSEGR